MRYTLIVSNLHNKTSIPIAIYTLNLSLSICYIETQLTQNTARKIKTHK